MGVKFGAKDTPEAQSEHDENIKLRKEQARALAEVDY